MRVVPLLIFLVCGLSVSIVAPEQPIGHDQATAAAIADDAAGQIQYETLQAQADLALDLLRQAQARRAVTAQFAAN